MKKVKINKTSFLKGEKGIISVECEGVEGYSQIQIEIFDTGVKNPKSNLI